MLILMEVLEEVLNWLDLEKKRMECSVAEEEEKWAESPFKY